MFLPYVVPITPWHFCTLVVVDVVTAVGEAAAAAAPGRS